MLAVGECLSWFVGREPWQVRVFLSSDLGGVVPEPSDNISIDTHTSSDSPEKIVATMTTIEAAFRRWFQSTGSH